MLQIEEELNGAFAAIDLYRLAADDGREGGEALLAIEQELGFGVGIGLLAYGKGLLRDGLIGFPDQDGARGIAAIEGIEEIANAGGTSGIAPLHFRQPQLTALDLADEFFDSGFCFGHGQLAP
jgi:hypothetical protein